MSHKGDMEKKEGKKRSQQLFAIARGRALIRMKTRN